MSSTHTWQLNIPTLPPAACVHHLFLAMKTTGLLSIGQLCDHGCSATFSQHHLVIKNKRAITILVGHRNSSNGTWMVQLDEQAQPHTTLPLNCNTIMLSDTTKKDLAHFHHASLGSPVPSTLLAAIDAGFLLSFPGLTTQLVKNTSPRASRQARATWTRNVKTYNQQNGIKPTHLLPSTHIMFSLPHHHPHAPTCSSVPSSRPPKQCTLFLNRR